MQCEKVLEHEEKLEKLFIKKLPVKEIEQKMCFGEITKGKQTNYYYWEAEKNNNNNNNSLCWRRCVESSEQGSECLYRWRENRNEESRSATTETEKGDGKEN